MLLHFFEALNSIQRHTGLEQHANE